MSTIQIQKQCSECESKNTVIHYTQNYPMLYKDPNDSYKLLCRKCYLKIVSNKKNMPRRIKFITKRILMPFDFRRNFCIKCGEYCTSTDFHHIEYIIIMPVCAFTVELCDYHHRLENLKQEQLGKDYYFEFVKEVKSNC